MSNLSYYIFLFAIIAVACFIIKKVASCLVKTIVLLVLLAILTYVYFLLK